MEPPINPVTAESRLGRKLLQPKRPLITSAEVAVAYAVLFPLILGALANWDGLRKLDSGWVQAIGSILAVGAGFLYVHWQNALSKRDAEFAEMNRIRKIGEIGRQINELCRNIGKIMYWMEGADKETLRALCGQAEFQLVHLNKMVAEIDSISLMSMPSIETMNLYSAFREFARESAKEAKSYLNTLDIGVINTITNGDVVHHVQQTDFHLFMFMRAMDRELGVPEEVEAAPPEVARTDSSRLANLRHLVRDIAVCAESACHWASVCAGQGAHARMSIKSLQDVMRNMFYMLKYARGVDLLSLPSPQVSSAFNSTRIWTTRLFEDLKAYEIAFFAGGELQPASLVATASAIQVFAAEFIRVTTSAPAKSAWAEFLAKEPEGDPPWGNPSDPR